MFSAIKTIISLSLVLIIHELGHFLVAKRKGVRVERFSFGFGPRLFSLKRGHCEFIISAIPFGGYVKLAGENFEEGHQLQPWDYIAKPIKSRAQIIVAGSALNYILGFLLFYMVFLLGAPALSPVIGKVKEGYPAQEAGLLAGDRILAIDNRPVKTWEDAAQIIHKKFNQKLIIKVSRDNKIFSLNLKTRVDELEDIFGDKTKVALIGIEPKGDIEFHRYGPLRSSYLAFKGIINLTQITYKGIWRMLTFRLSMRENVASPLGIFFIANRAAQAGLVYLFQITAILSASLAMFNLLPIPVLDGGHLMFLILEKIKGKRASIRAQEAVTPIVIFLLITLMLFAVYNDLIRLGLLEKITQQ
jgi:regulator of sigma E protease